MSDLIPDGAKLVLGIASRVRQVRVDVALAGDERALVFAAHGDNDVGLLGELTREQLRLAVSELDAQLAHHLDHLGTDAVRGRGSSGQRGVAAADGAHEQGFVIWERPA